MTIPGHHGGTATATRPGPAHLDRDGIAVLIDLLANATKRGRTLQFWNLPSGIVAAAKISDVDSILGIA